MNCLSCGQALEAHQSFCDRCGTPVVPLFSVPDDEKTPSTWRVSKEAVERAQAMPPMMKAQATHLIPESVAMLKAGPTRRMEAPLEEPSKPRPPGFWARLLRCFKRGG